MLKILSLLLATVSPPMGSSSIPGDNVTGPPVNPAIAIDASCCGSGFRMGTGNVPYGVSDRPTTIVNIWAEVQAGSKLGAAWIAKTVSGQYWIQINGKAPSTELADRVGRGPHLMASFTQYDQVFASIGAALTPCFTHDLPSAFYNYDSVEDPLHIPDRGQPSESQHEAIVLAMSREIPTAAHVGAGRVWVAGAWAIANWAGALGNGGGQALLAITGQSWHVVASSGGTLKSVALMQSHGVPAATAQALYDDLVAAGY
jgi:hypothetical protein